MIKTFMRGLRLQVREAFLEFSGLSQLPDGIDEDVQASLLKFIAKHFSWPGQVAKFGAPDKMTEAPKNLTANQLDSKFYIAMRWIAPKL